MRIRLVLLLVLLVGVAAGCASSANTTTSEDAESSANTTTSDDAASSAEAFVGTSPVDPLTAAVERATTDCFDPLHDSDGSGGFFDFCDRATLAKAAGQLDCFGTEYGLAHPEECEGWRVSAGEIPPYYFEELPEPTATSAESPPATELPADEAPPAQEQEPGEVRSGTGEPPLTPVPPLGGPSGVPAFVKVLEWNQIGGCEMLGDYCARHSVFGDGRVEANRRSGEVLSEGQVDVALVLAVMDNADVDIDRLVASLPPGPCEMARDGIDYEVWIGPADLRLTTCDVDLSGPDPLIVAARTLGEAAAAAAPWEVTD